MLEPEDIVEEVIAYCTPKVLAGRKVLITAGPTFEAIDPVRGVADLSSGRMGSCYAVARASSRHAGAEDHAGFRASSFRLQSGVHRSSVKSALEMHAAVIDVPRSPIFSSAWLPWPTIASPMRPSTD